MYRHLCPTEIMRGSWLVLASSGNPPRTHGKLRRGFCTYRWSKTYFTHVVRRNALGGQLALCSDCIMIYRLGRAKITSRTWGKCRMPSLTLHQSQGQLDSEDRLTCTSSERWQTESNFADRDSPAHTKRLTRMYMIWAVCNGKCRYSPL